MEEEGKEIMNAKRLGRGLGSRKSKIPEKKKNIKKVKISDQTGKQVRKTSR